MPLECGDKFKARGFQFEHAHLSTVVCYEPILACRVKLELSVKAKPLRTTIVVHMYTCFRYKSNSSLRLCLTKLPFH